MSDLILRRDWDMGLWVLVVVGATFCLGSMILNAILSTMTALGGLQ